MERVLCLCSPPPSSEWKQFIESHSALHLISAAMNNTFVTDWRSSHPFSPSSPLLQDIIYGHIIIISSSKRAQNNWCALLHAIKALLNKYVNSPLVDQPIGHNHHHHHRSSHPIINVSLEYKIQSVINDVLVWPFFTASHYKLITLKGYQEN